MRAEKFIELKSQIDVISSLPSDYCLDQLEERMKRELHFHDRYRDRQQEQGLDEDVYEKIYGNRKYYSATRTSCDYVSNWIESESPGKVFLDYCCGNGKNAFAAARSGAALSIGIDLSSVSLQNARDDAARQGLKENIVFLQANAEDTRLPDQSIERVVCSGVLHHLDREKAFTELARIVAPGGKILSIEALDYNPAIKLYRYLTPEMRTEYEMANILSLKDLKLAKRYFKIGAVRYWHILGILSPHLPLLGSTFEKLDSMLCRIPLVKLMAWIFTFELIKPIRDRSEA